MFVSSRSDIGKVRSQNQDAVFVSTEPVGPLPNLLIVADGMGGHNAGDVASSHAVLHFTEYLRRQTAADDSFLDLLVAAAAHANREVFSYSLSNTSLSGMGTTLTACVLTGYPVKCEIVHVGDSRAYLVSPDGITQLTRDHSYVCEMVKAGQLTPAEAREHPKRNVLTRVLGVDADFHADGYVYDIAEGCSVLLCSDGLTNMLTDDRIHALAYAHQTPRERVDALIAEANALGGNDNISIVLADI